MLAVTLLLFYASVQLIAQAKPNDQLTPGKAIRSNALYDLTGQANHSLPLNAISTSILLDSSRVNRDPVKLNVPAVDRRLPSDSLGHRVDITLQAEVSSGNWNRIFTPNLSKNQN